MRRLNSVNLDRLREIGFDETEDASDDLDAMLLNLQEDKSVVVMVGLEDRPSEVVAFDRQSDFNNFGTPTEVGKKFRVMMESGGQAWSLPTSMLPSLST